MQGTLINNLYQYIRENNPDLLMELEETGSVTKYLSDKVSLADSLFELLCQQQQPGYIMEEVCMNFLTKDLKPSRYNYICVVLEADFEQDYKQLIESGLLKLEVCNMIKYCQPVFDGLNFSEENEDNRFVQYAITGTISRYLYQVTSVKENVSDALQQSTKITG